MDSEERSKQEGAYGNMILMWLGIILFVAGLIAKDNYLFLGGAGLFVFMAVFGGKQ